MHLLSSTNFVQKKTLAFFIVFTFLLCAIPSTSVQGQSIPANTDWNDTIDLPANTIQVIARVNEINNTEVSITVLTIKGQGQGIMNTLSEGEEITLSTLKKTKHLKGKKIEAFLHEKIEMDASRSYYSLSMYKEL